MVLEPNSTGFHLSCWLKPGSFSLSLKCLPAFIYLSIFYYIFEWLGWNLNSLAQSTKAFPIFLDQPFQPCPAIPYADTLNFSLSPGHTRSLHETICLCTCSILLPKASPILPPSPGKLLYILPNRTEMLPSQWNFFDFLRQKSVLPSSVLLDHTLPHCTASPVVITGTTSSRTSTLWGALYTLNKYLLYICLPPFCSKCSIKFQMAVSYNCHLKRKISKVMNQNAPWWR